MKPLIRFIAALVGLFMAFLTQSIHAEIAPDDDEEVIPSNAQSVLWCSTPQEKLLVKVYNPQGELLPVVPIRVLTELEACRPDQEGLRAQEALKKIQEAKYQRVLLSRSTIKEDSPYHDPFIFEECANGLPCEVDAWVSTSVPLTSGFGKTGGLPFAAVLGHTGDAGHYEVTKTAMMSAQSKLTVSWPVSMVELVARASGDADFFDWGTPAAHAQTSNDDKTGRINESQQEALANYRKWISKYAKKSVEQCRVKDPSGAAYFLGYFLHAVQDLAFHEGITNAEHSYLDSDYVHAPVDSSDGRYYKKKMNLAVLGSERVLVGYFSFLRSNWPECWTAMRNGTIEAPSFWRKLQLLGRGPDFGVWPLIQFKGLATKIYRNSKSREDEDYFINSLWLGNLQEEKMINMANEIVATNFDQ